MKTNTGFLPVFKRECIRIATSKIYIWGAIVANILSLALLTYLMNTGLPSKIPVAVVDMDNTSTTRSLIAKLNAAHRTDVKYTVGSFLEANDLMDRLEVYAILMIPHNFTSDLVKGNQPKLSYYTNSAFKIAGSLMVQDLETVGALASASVEMSMAGAKGYGPPQITTIVSPIGTEAHPIHNPYLNYAILLNGIMLACILQLIIVLFTISSLGSEMKSDTAQELINTAGGSSWKMMLGKLLPNTLVFILIALLEISVLNYYNGFPMFGGFWELFLGYVGLIIASQGFGIILFAVFANYRMAISSGSLLSMLSFSLVGFSYPTAQMNPVLNSVSHIFPVKTFYYIFGDQGLNGYPLSYSYSHYLFLLGFAFVGVVLFGRVRKILEFEEYKP